MNEEKDLIELFIENLQQLKVQKEKLYENWEQLEIRQKIRVESLVNREKLSNELNFITLDLSENWSSSDC